MNKKESDEFIKNAKLVIDRIFDYGFHTFKNSSSRGNDPVDSSSVPDLPSKHLINYGL